MEPSTTHSSSPPPPNGPVAPTGATGPPPPSAGTTTALGTHGPDPARSRPPEVTTGPAEEEPRTARPFDPVATVDRGDPVRPPHRVGPDGTASGTPDGERGPLRRGAARAAAPRKERWSRRPGAATRTHPPRPVTWLSRLAGAAALTAALPAPAVLVVRAVPPFPGRRRAARPTPEARRTAE
ncbi:hypothetical protein ACSR0Z_26345 [Streptomyces viridosporus]